MSGALLSASAPTAAAAFSPTDIANLKLWLKADAGTFQTSGGSAATADSDPVGEWQDQSGNGKHMVQATSTKRGTLKTGIQNGKPVVRGDGTDDFLASATVASTAVDNFTCFIAYKNINTSTFDLIFSNGSDAQNNGHAYWIHQSNFRFLPYWPTQLADGAYTTNTFEIVRYKRAAGTTTLFVNGASATIDNDTTSPATPLSTLVLGWPAAHFATADIGEVLLYDAALSAGDITSVETYLNGRWAAF